MRLDNGWEEKMMGKYFLQLFIHIVYLLIQDSLT